MESPSRKRSRPWALCLVCRKRKSKCDRQRPVCGQCRKKLIAHLCMYEDEPRPSPHNQFVPLGPGVVLPGHTYTVAPAPASAYAPNPYPLAPVYQNSWGPPPYDQGYQHPQQPLHQQHQERRFLALIPVVPPPFAVPPPLTLLALLDSLSMTHLPLISSSQKGSPGIVPQPYAAGPASPTVALNALRPRDPDQMSPLLTPANSTHLKHDFSILLVSTASDKDKLYENFVLVLIGNNILRIPVDETMSAFSNAANTLLIEGGHWQQQGPLSYIGLMKRDQFTKLVRHFTVSLFTSEQHAQFFKKNDPAQLESEIDSALDSELTVDTVITNKISSGEENLRVVAHALPVDSLKAFYRHVEKEVLSILPRKQCIEVAINNFFQHVHPFVPIFHEETFLSQIRPLFRKSLDSGEYHRSILIRNDNHLNLAGQLLLIVRLGYMTLIPNNQTDMGYTVEEQHLIQDITRFKSDEYMRIVSSCMPEERVQLVSTFKCVQSLCLLIFYRSVLPNDCLGLSGTDSQILFSAIVSHALSIGLNRDPTKYASTESVSQEPSFINTWRLLWLYIVNLDAMLAMNAGTALKIPNLGIADVQQPDYNTFLDQLALYISQVNEISGCYRRIINRITNLSSEVRVVDLLSETSKLEKLVLEIFGKDFFRDVVCKPAPEEPRSPDRANRGLNEPSIMKVHLFVLFVSTRANLSSLYYLVVLHTEQRFDEDEEAEVGAGIELLKIFVRSVVQLVYIMSYALDNAQELFGRSYDYLLTSRIERLMIKTHNFVSSFFIRLINYKRTLAIQAMSETQMDLETKAKFDQRCEVVDNLFTISLIEAELFVGHFRTLSNTHINSYKLYVMAFFVLKQCMENPELLLAGFADNKGNFFNDGTNIIQFLSTDELTNICNLFEEFRLAKLELMRRQRSHQGSSGAAASGEQASSSSAKYFDPISSSFDATEANRAMYANKDTVNTYGLLTEKHMHADYQQEVFDEQNMIGNDELLQIFEHYGYFDA